MAEVYGNIGDQPVELNNAASEATLKSLLEVAKAQYEKQVGGKNSKAYKDLEKNLNNLVKQSRNFNNTVAKSTVELDKKTKSVRALRQEYEKQQLSMKKLAVGTAKVVKGFAKAYAGINQMASQISKFGNSMSAATQMANHLPLIGKEIGAALGAVAQAVETTQRSFIDAASIGANFGGSMEKMIDHATNAGLTIDQFSQIIRGNGESLAFLSSSTAEGAKRLSLLSSTMRKSGVQDRLAYLGYSLEDINTGMLTFSGMLAKGGVNIRAMANERLVELTNNYMTNLDAVSKLTGQSRKELEKQRQERQRDSRNRILERRLDVDSRNRLNAAFDIVGPEMSKGLQDIFMGYVQSPESQDLMTFQSEAAQMASRLGDTMRRTGTLTSAQVDMLVQSLANGAKQINDSELVNVLGGPLAERYGNFVVANMDLERLRGKSLEEIEKEIQTELAARKAAGKEADPADIMRTQQDLAKASNEATEFLVKQTGILTGALDLMSGALRHTISYLNDLVDLGRKEGLGAVLKKVGSDIFDAMKRAISYLFESLYAIGERLGKALWNSLPSSLKNWFGSQEEKETARLANDKKTLETEIAQTQKLVSGEVKPNRQQAMIDQPAKLAGLQKQLADLDAKINERAQAQAGPQTLPPVPPAQQKAAAAQTQATNNNTAATERQAALAENEAEQARVRQQREAARHEERIEAEEDNTKATVANTSTVKAASTCELDYSSPQALFNSFAKIMVGGKAGVTDSVSGTSLTQRPPSHIGGGQSVFSADVQGLSNLIYSAEGTSDERARQHGIASGYDVTYGYGKYASTDKPLSEMTIAEVKEYQKRQIAATRGEIDGTDQGTGAVGKAQITQGTLADLQKQMGFKDTDVFSPELQDQMMVKLLERSGLKDFQSGKITANQFQDRIAGTWASIGKSGTGKSAYGQPTNSGATSKLQQVLAGLKDGTQTVTPSAAQAAESASQDKSGSATPTTPGPGAPAAVSSAASGQGMQTDALNTQMAQLIKSNSDLLAVANQQLRALRGMSSDGFVNA